MKTQNKTRIVFVLCFATLLITLTASRAFADQSFSFHVTNSQGSPLSGAFVSLQGSEGSLTDIPYGAYTDQNGNVNFLIPSGITITSYAVQENGYTTFTGNYPSSSTTIQLSPVGNSSPNPSPGPNPSSSPRLNDHGIQWTVNPKDVETWIIFLVIVVIIAVLIGSKKGKKKEK